jgi:4a-hydroxytetrahydrobiopterin dehydratase
MAQLLSDDEITRGLEGLRWTRQGDTIVTTVMRPDFVGSLAFVNAVGQLAEARNHHPDIAISWSKVTLTLSTHSAGGLTQSDLDLAAAIDAIDGAGAPDAPGPLPT